MTRVSRRRGARVFRAEKHDEPGGGREERRVRRGQRAQDAGARVRDRGPQDRPGPGSAGFRQRVPEPRAENIMFSLSRLFPPAVDGRSRFSSLRFSYMLVDFPRLLAVVHEVSGFRRDILRTERVLHVRRDRETLERREAVEFRVAGVLSDSQVPTGDASLISGPLYLCLYRLYLLLLISRLFPTIGILRYAQKRVFCIVID